MRQLFFACALALTACATSQANADPLSADPLILLSCVGEAGTERDALSQCAFRMARHCIAEEGGSNSITDVLCLSAEADVWQALVEENTARIAAADPVDGELLAAANQAWTQWREAECSYRAYDYGGGSGEQFDRVSCHLMLTITRALELTVD